jgi:hypothetical protein
MRLMTTPILVLIYAAAAVVLLGIFAGIPVWITYRKPDNAPEHNLPRYLRAEWESISERIPAHAGHRSDH